ncbi:MAG: hypothetical protein HPY59_16535 [Anaerolineae bacterium]|nr:hypothetical protein [Anaerolineae bacterium]
MSAHRDLPAHSAPASSRFALALAGLKQPVFQLVLVMALTLAGRLFYVLFTGFATDDAFITFRYAHMLAEGQGFVYNPGERVYGTTTPLFTFLIAGWLLISGSSPLVGARLVEMIAAMGASAFTYLAVRRLGGSLLQQTLAGLSLGLCISQWSHDTNGMETALLPCLMAASWFALAAKQYTWAGILCGLLLWTRLDTILWPLALTFAALFEDRRAAIRMGLIAAAMYSPWLIFASIYFGSPIPHTVAAKIAAYTQNNATSFFANTWTVIKYLTPIPVSPARPGFLILVASLTLSLAGIHAWRSRRSILQLALVFFALLELIRLAISGATFFNRYFVPLLWAVLTLAAQGLGYFWEQLKPSNRPAIGWLAFWLSTAITAAFGALLPIGSGSNAPSLADSYVVVSLWLLLFPFLLLLFSNFKRRGRPAHWAGLAALALTLVFFSIAAGRQLLPSLRFIRASQIYRGERSLQAMGQWLAVNSPPGATVLLEPLGYVGYYSNRVMRDEVGLVTPDVTRLKQAGNLDVYDYLEELRPDYVIQHCDDILEWQRREPPEQNLLIRNYRMAKQFNPLAFDPVSGYNSETDFGPISRQSCYEIWEKK